MHFSSWLSSLTRAACGCWSSPETPTDRQRVFRGKNQFMVDETVDYQLVPPRVHRRNAAGRAANLHVRKSLRRRFVQCRQNLSTPFVGQTSPAS